MRKANAVVLADETFFRDRPLPVPLPVPLCRGVHVGEGVDEALELEL